MKKDQRLQEEDSLLSQSTEETVSHNFTDEWEALSDWETADEWNLAPEDWEIPDEWDVIPDDWSLDFVGWEIETPIEW